MFKQFIESINYVIEDKVILKTIQSPYFSLLFDESLDSSQSEQLIIYIRYYED